MSTDLEFRQGLPQLRLSTIRIKPSQPTDITPAAADDINVVADEITTIQTSNSGSDSGDECHTPTSPEHKIPAILSCPPAPKKPRRAVQCKRKLCELQFFEIVAREEIESFFRSSFELVDVNSSDVAKRRCPCT